MKEKKREEKDEIKIIDGGIDMKETATPMQYCCYGPYSPLRG